MAAPSDRESLGTGLPDWSWVDHTLSPLHDWAGKTIHGLMAGETYSSCTWEYIRSISHKLYLTMCTLSLHCV